MILRNYVDFYLIISGEIILTSFVFALIRPSQAANQFLNVKILSIKASHPNVIEGDTVDLICTGIGSLNYSLVDWIHNDKLLNLSSSLINRYEAQLHLTNVTRYQSGRYVCVIRQGGSSFEPSEPLDLQVLYPGMVKSLILDSAFPIINNMVQIKCEFQQGNPKVRVYIGRLGNMLPSQTEFDQSNQSLLAVRNMEVMTKSEAGLYSCRVENDAGFSELARRINVVNKPTVSSITIINSEVRIGSNVQLKCDISDYGSPRGRISWFQNGYLLKKEDSPSILINNLQNRNVGLYICEVRNEYGFSSQQLTLHHTYKKYSLKSAQLKSETIYYSPAQNSGLVMTPIFLGVFIGTFILLIIIGLIIYYVKRETSEVNEDL